MRDNAVIGNTRGRGNPSPPLPKQPDWLLVRTSPLAEYKVQAMLARKGVEVFLPSVKAPQPRNGRIDAPLFPGYLFARLVPRLFRDAPEMSRCAHLVKLGDEYAVLHETIIEELRRRVADLNRGVGLWPCLKVGQAVLVRKGKIEQVAQILRLPRSPHQGVLVLLELMGRPVRAIVAWEDCLSISKNVTQGRWIGRRTRGRGRWIAEAKGFFATRRFEQRPIPAL
jgi:hypothetical protein